MKTNKDINLLRMYNNNLLKDEVQSLYSLMKCFMSEDDSAILSLAFQNYLVLIVVEGINYLCEISNLDINYEYKRQLNKCRAKIKPYQLELEQITTKISNLNYETMEYYSNDLPNIIKVLFNNMITNLGIYKYKKKIISNTFLITSDQKYLMYTNNKIDTEKMFSSSKTIGELLSLLMKVFKNDYSKISQSNITEKFELEDFKVIDKENKLLKRDIDLNIELFLLDILSVLNFYNLIIREANICESLKYRIGYITFYRTYHNLNKILDKKVEMKFNNLNKICKKYNVLDNRVFRNGMSHYNIVDKLDIIDLKPNEMYLGLINKYLKMDDLYFKNALDNYCEELSNEIERSILK